MTADATGVGKEIELNPFRIQRRAPNAKSEETMQALRVRRFQQWSQALDETEREIKVYLDRNAEKERRLRRTCSKL